MIAEIIFTIIAAFLFGFIVAHIKLKIDKIKRENRSKKKILKQDFDYFIGTKKLDLQEQLNPRENILEDVA